MLQGDIYSTTTTCTLPSDRTEQRTQKGPHHPSITHISLYIYEVYANYFDSASVSRKERANARALEGWRGGRNSATFGTRPCKGLGEVETTHYINNLVNIKGPTISFHTRVPCNGEGGDIYIFCWGAKR